LQARYRRTMNSLPSAPAAAQEKYEIQAGTVHTGIITVDVEAANGVIVSAPVEFDHWVGRKMHELEWHLAYLYGTSQKRRVGV